LIIEESESDARNPMSDDSEKIIDIYKRHARTYAEDRGSALMEKALLDEFLAGASSLGCE
jgi:hypothetical protein